VFLLRELSKDERLWDVIVDPARKVRIGNKIYFSDKLMCEVIDNTTSRGRTVRFNYQGDFFKLIDNVGQTPLPPYIKREAGGKRTRRITRPCMRARSAPWPLPRPVCISRKSCSADEEKRRGSHPCCCISGMAPSVPWRSRT
jgi:S-adenosylmethionine:tRNA-ribosyltransferase-isomerase (queuine synthetase)